MQLLEQGQATSPPESGDDAATLLGCARALYRQSSARHRDALVGCGRVLHRFVLAHVRRGDGKSEYLRLKHEHTRRGATEAAAESLGVENRKVNGLIATAAAVDLLSAGGEVGELCYDTLYNFARFVRRRTGSRDARREGGQENPSDVEVWEVKPGFGVSAPRLFARAVEEGFDTVRARREVVKLFRGSSTSARPLNEGAREGPGDGPPLPSRQACARVVSPGDVADMCMDLVRAAADPLAVIARLKALLAAYVPPRKRIAL